MNTFGKSLLAIRYSFHRWHKQHLKISLAVVVAAGILFLISRIPRLPTYFDHFPEWFLKLDEWIGLFSVLFFGVAILAGVSIRLLAKIWPAPYVPFVTTLPDPLEVRAGSDWVFGDYLGDKFRYRFAEQSDLQIFSGMSAGDPAIENANPGLDRERLYTTWIETNPETFMFLDVQNRGELRWEVGAISIVLPLTRRGYDGLWSGNVEVKDIGPPHIAAKGSRPTAILIDTLIANPTYRKRNAAMVLSLSVVHASRFWVPEGRKKIEYLIEPDHAKFPQLLPEMGFEGPHSIKRGHKLFKFTYPFIRNQQSERAKETSSLLVENIRRASKWRIGF